MVLDGLCGVANERRIEDLMGGVFRYALDAVEMSNARFCEVKCFVLSLDDVKRVPHGVLEVLFIFGGFNC